MKKILILGGSYFQIPAIAYAKLQGYYVITCDYLPDNPGHKLADEYHNVSTTDKKGVLSLARDLKVDGVLCFASDPAATVAAYVTEQLALPGNAYDKVRVFGEKHLWRDFLSENGFNTPKAKAYSCVEEVDADLWDYPVMLKPIDSSGSKGVTKVCHKDGIKKAFEYALTYSRSKIVIMEEFIERVGSQIGGDGFYGTEQLDFVCFGEQVVDLEVNPYVPCGMKFPANLSSEMRDMIFKEIERAVRLSGLRNLSFNLEVMIDKSNKIYLMELGPRNGGNCIPEIINQYTDVDLVALAVEAAMGKTLLINENRNTNFHAYYALHSDKSGVYRGYWIDKSFQGDITRSYIFLDEGASVRAFNGSNETIGILLIKFHLRADIDSFFSCPDKYVHLMID